MDGEDDESDKGREDEEDSDEAQAEVDRTVAQMLHNQQQYIHMRNPSAQILQLLSHLVPGMTMSGQALDLESVTEDSEDGTSRSESASSHSPVTSDDNAGCVLWAEPIMTCRLLPSWKPFCNDVRRLPPGVKPEDLKDQHIPTCTGSSFSSCPSAAAAIKYRCQCAASRKGSTSLPGSTNPGNVSKDTNLQSSRTEGQSNPFALEGQNVGSTGSRNSQRLTSSVGNLPKVPCAADAIARTRKLLAAVTSGRQANNNYNPEEISRRKGSHKESAASKAEQESSDKDISGNTTAGYNADDDTGTTEPHKVRPAEALSTAHTDTSAHSSFPALILVRAAGVQTGTVHAVNGAAEDSLKDAPSLASVCNPNKEGSGSHVYEIYEHKSQMNVLNTQSPNSRGRCTPSNHVRDDKIQLGSLEVPVESQMPGSVRRSRTSGQLYRYPASANVVHSNNRTQQSVSLGCGQRQEGVLPPPVNLPVGTQSAKATAQLLNQQLKLDFSSLVTPPSNKRMTRKHTITLDQLKNALRIVRHNLHKYNMLKVNENSMFKEPSPKTKSTTSALAMTEVESVNIPADQGEKDSAMSDTVKHILSDMFCETTDVANTSAGGDGDRSTEESFTEVENIFYVHHRSPIDLNKGLEAKDIVRSFNDGEEGLSDRNRTNSSCLQQEGNQAGSRCSSRVSPNPGEESSSRMSRKHIDEVSSKRDSPYKQLLNQVCVKCPNTELAITDDSSKMETEVREISRAGDLRSRKQFEQTETCLSENTTVQTNHKTLATCLRCSNSDTLKCKEEIQQNNHYQGLYLQFPRAKSAENAATVKQHQLHLKSCRMYSPSEKKTLEGKDRDNEMMLVVKEGGGFPPHFPEAGDTVGNTANFTEAKVNSLSSTYQEGHRHETEQCNTQKWNKAQQLHLELITTSDCGRKDDTNLFRIHSFQPDPNRQTFIHSGKSNNASPQQETTLSKSTSHNELFDPTLLPSETRGAYSVVQVNATDSITENKPDMKKKNTQTIDLGESSSHTPVIVYVKQQTTEDYGVPTSVHRSVCEERQQDNSAALSYNSDSLISLSRGTPVSKQSKEDVFVNTTDISPKMTVIGTETFQGKSDTFIRSHRRTRDCASKTSHVLISVCNKDNNLRGEPTPSNIKISRSSGCHDIDVFPDLMPIDDGYSHRRLPVTSTRTVSMSSELRDTPLNVMECNSKTTLSELLDKEETADKQRNPQTCSVMTQKGSPNSSRSFAFQVPGVTGDTPSASVLVTSSEVNPASSSSAAPVNNPLPREKNGLKTRLRRFFSQCLHPFSHRY